MFPSHKLGEGGGREEEGREESSPPSARGAPLYAGASRRALIFISPSVMRQVSISPDTLRRASRQDFPWAGVTRADYVCGASAQGLPLPFVRREIAIIRTLRSLAGEWRHARRNEIGDWRSVRTCVISETTAKKSLPWTLSLSLSLSPLGALRTLGTLSAGARLRDCAIVTPAGDPVD